MSNASDTPAPSEKCLQATNDTPAPPALPQTRWNQHSNFGQQPSNQQQNFGQQPSNFGNQQYHYGNFQEGYGYNQNP